MELKMALVSRFFFDRPFLVQWRICSQNALEAEGFQAGDVTALPSQWQEGGRDKWAERCRAVGGEGGSGEAGYLPTLPAWQYSLSRMFTARLSQAPVPMQSHTSEDEGRNRHREALRESRAGGGGRVNGAVVRRAASVAGRLGQWGPETVGSRRRKKEQRHRQQIAAKGG